MSKKVLIKISPPLWPIFDIEIEILKKELIQKKEVTIITCNAKKNFCVANEKMSKIKCSFCKLRLKKGINILNKYHNKIKTIDENIDYKLVKSLKKIEKVRKFHDLKKIKFNKIDFGQSIASSLATIYKTENFDTKKNNNLIKELFIQSLSSYYFFKYLLLKNKYNKYLIFNGRIYNYRPLLRLGQQKRLNLYCYDYHYFSHKRYLIRKLDFTQNIHLRANEIYKISRVNNINLKEAKKFFKRRFNKKGIGPFAIYNAIQKDNSLPNKIKDNKTIISIFTSSDLETNFLTDNKQRYIYKSQYEAIKKILNVYRNNKKINFFIRAHPNTIFDNYENEKYKKISKFHKRCFYIDPMSEISSYSLIKNSDIILCFGSTIGIEAVYLKKNVINLGPSPYMKFKIDFQPKNHNQNVNIIDKLIKNNKFNNTKYTRCLIATGAMLQQGIKLKYLNKEDFMHAEFNWHRKKNNLKIYNIVSLFYNVLLVYERVNTLIKYFFSNKKLFNFKLKNYYYRLKQLTR